MDRICAGCGEPRGITHHEFDQYWHYACLLRERAARWGMASIGRRQRRTDGLKGSSRKARKKRGKPIKGISMPAAAFDKLKAWAHGHGMSMGTAIQWLIDNRPEIHYKPIILKPRGPKQTDLSRAEELAEFIEYCESVEDIESDPELWRQYNEAYSERYALMTQQST